MTSSQKPGPFGATSSLYLSPHFKAQMATKGFTSAQVISALRSPEKITEVRRYPGQWRYCGAGVAVVVDFNSEMPRAVTLYADGIVTPMRPDQVNDAHAIRSIRLARM